MILKMNRKSRGRKGVVEYLLNEREKEGTATTLRGNPEITKNLIKTIERKHKYLSGGLMFAKEEYINKNQKNQIMDAFEEILFTGLSSNQYNILWVEHSDKERIELNFVVPRLELNTGHDLDLYSHRRDLPIFDMWKNGINTKYKLADPNDPRRARTMPERAKNAKGKVTTIVANRRTLDETLHKLVQNREIQDRNQMIELLHQNGYVITRKNSESISIKHSDIGIKALRLKGGIYSENFTSIRSIESICKERKLRIREHDNKVARGEAKELGTIYQSYLYTRTERHKKRYSRTERTDRKESQNIEKRVRNNLATAVNIQNKRIGIDDGIRSFIENSNSKREEYIKRIRARESELLEQIKNSNIQLSNSHRKAEQELFTSATHSRRDVEDNITRNAERINAEVIRADEYNKRRSSKVHELFAGVNEQFSKLKKSIKGVVDEIKKLKLFEMAKNEMMSKSKTSNLSRRR